MKKYFFLVVLLGVIGIIFFSPFAFSSADTFSAGTASAFSQKTSQEQDRQGYLIEAQNLEEYVNTPAIKQDTSARVKEMRKKSLDIVAAWRKTANAL